MPPRERQLAGGVAHNPTQVRRRVLGKDERTPSIPLAQVPPPNNIYVIRKHGRAFAIADPAGRLVCITVCLAGAFEMIRRLGGVAVYAKPAKHRRRYGECLILVDTFRLAICRLPVPQLSGASSPALPSLALEGIARARRGPGVPRRVSVCSRTPGDAVQCAGAPWAPAVPSAGPPRPSRA